MSNPNHLEPKIRKAKNCQYVCGPSLLRVYAIICAFHDHHGRIPTLREVTRLYGCGAHNFVKQSMERLTKVGLLSSGEKAADGGIAARSRMPRYRIEVLI